MTIGEITLDANGRYVSGLLPKDNSTPSKTFTMSPAIEKAIYPNGMSKAQPKIQAKGEFMVPDNMVDILMPNTPKQVQQPATQIFVEPQVQQPIEDILVLERNIKPQVEAQILNQQVENYNTPVINNIRQDIVENNIQNTYNNIVNNAIYNNIAKNNYINAIVQNNFRNYATYEDINNYVAQQNLNNAINNQIAQNIFARNAIIKNAMIRNAIQDAIYTDAATRMMENMMLAQAVAPMCRPRICPRRRGFCPRCAANYFHPINQMRRNIFAMQMMAMYNNFMTMMGYMFGRMINAQYAAPYMY